MRYSICHVGRNIDWVTAQYDDRFIAIGPFAKGHYLLIGFPSHNEHIDGFHESCITAVLALGHCGIGSVQPVEFPANWRGDREAGDCSQSLRLLLDDC